MAKPATEARLAAAAKGYTQVIGRGNAHIVARKQGTKQCCYIGQVGGGWHYNGDQETDTAWEQDAIAEYLKMIKAGYNLRARKLFNAGDLIQWTDPVSGQYVKFQPVNFQWIDGTTGSNSLISVAQAISSPTIDNDKLYWPAAFGAGRHFRYTAAPTKLIKHLIIDSAANLPACPTWITNPWLELTFTLTPSSGVTMYVDGLAWNQATTKTTANAIEFRLPSGQVVWSMAAPLAYDSSPGGAPLAGQIKLYVNKKVKYASVRFPKAWIDSAVFPIILDPAVDYQVGAGANDGIVLASNIYPTHGYLYFGFMSTNPRHFYCRWPNVIIPDGATVTASYVSFCYHTSEGTPPECVVYFENAANPAAPSSASDFEDRTKTTAKINIAGPVLTDGDWWDTGSLNSILNELLGAHSYASPGAAMQLLEISSGSGTNYSSQFSYDGDSAKAPKLHIEYTEAAGGKPAANVIWIG